MRKEKEIIEFFEGLKPFKTIDNIPNIPIVESEIYNNCIVPNLIRCGAIPKEKLITGKRYEGACRNASEAEWDGEKFTYKRHKFGDVYDESINHFQDDDGYDLFVPLKEIED